jgi:4-amino-4-deoxy-L-arabinose transferase-like glycosyltransferase
MRKLTWFTVLILGGALFLRIYQIPQRFIFDIDTQYQALYARTIVRDFHIVWIGVSASNIGYYLGPGLTYLTAFLLWINSDPVVMGYFASFVGALTLLSVWFVARKLFGDKAALIATTVYGFTPIIIAYDRKFWPIFVPFIAVWMTYALVMSQKNKWWLLACAFLVGLSFHVHLSLMLFIPFVLYAFWKSGTLSFRMTNVKIIVGSLLTYLALTSPLLVFDFVHNFDNLLTPLRFIQNIGKGTGVMPRTFPWMFAGGIVLSVALWKIYTNHAMRWVLAILATICLAFTFYPGPMQEYYLVILFPFVAMAIGFVLHKLPSRILAAWVLVFAVWGTTLFIEGKSPRRLEVKKQMITRVCKTIRKPYYLEIGGDKRDYEGWYYLITVYCKRPDRSDVDSMFGWLYPEYLQNALPVEQLQKVRMQ